MENKKSTPRFSLPVRIFCIALAVLVTGGALTYLIMLIMGLIQ